MKKLDENYYHKTNEDETRFLNPEEKILWKGIPRKNSFVLQDTIKLAPFAIIWLCIDIFIFFMIFESADVSVFIFIVPFMVIHLTPVWIWIGKLITSAKKIKTKRYYLTDSRLLVVNIKDGCIVSQGIINDIVDTHISKSTIDEILHTADIRITFKDSSFFYFYDMVNPEEIIKKIATDKENYIETNLKCPYCDSSLEDEFIRFCPYCGAKLK